MRASDWARSHGVDPDSLARLRARERVNAAMAPGRGVIEQVSAASIAVTDVVLMMARLRSGEQGGLGHEEHGKDVGTKVRSSCSTLMSAGCLWDAARRRCSPECRVARTPAVFGRPGGRRSPISAMVMQRRPRPRRFCASLLVLMLFR